MSRPSAPSVEAITASFPYPSFPVIHTQPNREEIDKFEKMSIANAAARQSTRGGGMHGHMGMVLSPARYALHAAIPYVFEPNPGEAPIYPPGVTGVAQRTLDNEWQRNATIYQDQQAVHAALKNQLFRAIPEAYWAGITNPLTGMAGISLIEMYAHLYTNYGALMEDDLEDNRARLTEQFDFGTQPIETYWQKVQEVLTLADTGGAPITDAEVVRIALRNINHSGVYPLDVREWRIRPANEHTYANLKLAFTAAQVRTRSDRARINNPMANTLQQVEDALAGLTDAASADRAQALEAREENSRLLASINQLHVRIEQLHVGPQANNVQQPSPPQPMNIIPQYAPHVQHFQQMQHYQPQQFGHGGPMQQYPQQNYGRGGRRYGQRARGRMRGGYAPMTPIGPPGQTMGQGVAPPRVPPPHNHYCWTHGRRVAHDGSHTSATCFSPAPGHIVTATLTNICGGNPQGVT
jgi:hypothetical protein